jgi:hypothetical protein
MSRIPLGKTAKRVLAMLAEHGPTPLSHGARYAEITTYQIRVMASTNHLLRASGMVEWAGGNHDRWTVRLTDYGRECHRLGSHDPLHRAPSFHASYGPSPDDANDWYSEPQLDEIARIAKAAS